MFRQKKNEFTESKVSAMLTVKPEFVVESIVEKYREETALFARSVLQKMRTNDDNTGSHNDDLQSIGLTSNVCEDNYSRIS